MSKKRSFYENVYTKQLEEAVFDQKGYDSKKAEEKAKVKAANLRQRYLTRIFYSLMALGVTVVAYRLINLDPDNSGPIAVFLALCAMVYGFVKFIHK